MKDLDFNDELDKLFNNAIGVHDTIWYSKTETLRDAIVDLHEYWIEEFIEGCQEAQSIMDVKIVDRKTGTEIK